jgi:hypothetical protein
MNENHITIESMLPKVLPRALAWEATVGFRETTDEWRLPCER